jgi:hypothetical protein
VLKLMIPMQEIYTLIIDMFCVNHVPGKKSPILPMFTRRTCTMIQWLIIVREKPRDRQKYTSDGTSCARDQDERNEIYQYIERRPIYYEYVSTIERRVIRRSGALCDKCNRVGMHNCTGIAKHGICPLAKEMEHLIWRIRPGKITRQFLFIVPHCASHRSWPRMFCTSYLCCIIPI